MKVVILKDAKEVAQYGAAIFIKQIKKKPNSVLGLATGSTPVALYNELIANYQNSHVSFSDVRSFNLDEYLGLSSEHPQSYRSFMNNKLFNHVNIDKANTLVPDGAAKNPLDACQAYEQAIKSANGIDIQLLGIGRNGHIGFNEPSSSLASRTRVKTLTKETIDDNARFFAKDEFQPHLSITMGIGTIIESKQVILLATGKNKAQAIVDTVQGYITAQCPASALQFHPNAVVIIDEDAASLLKDRDFFRHIEKENQKLEQRLTA